VLPPCPLFLAPAIWQTEDTTTCTRAPQQSLREANRTISRQQMSTTRTLDCCYIYCFIYRTYLIVEITLLPAAVNKYR